VVSDHVWTLDASDGELVVQTEVAGRAARLGHRLTLAVNSWRASVSWSGGQPVTAELTADVDSLEVLRGSGGLKSLSAPEKALARSNALGSLDAKTFPRITFSTKQIHASDDGYSMAGTLTVRDRERPCTIDLHVADLGTSWRMSCSTVVRQSEYGVKPYSLMMGSIRVADDVTVSFSAERAKGD
jgi:polyisoprenoid-binding protein YceI